MLHLYISEPERLTLWFASCEVIDGALGIDHQIYQMSGGQEDLFFVEKHNSGHVVTVS